MLPVCFVLGAGAGIGGTVGGLFAKSGYHAVLARRSDEAGLKTLVDGIQSQGGAASGFLMNAVEDGVIEEQVLRIERDVSGQSTRWSIT